MYVGGKRSTRVQRRTLAAALAVVVSLVSTGCLRGTASVEIEEDRSGRIEFELEPSVQLVPQLDTIDLEAVIAAATGASVEFEDVGRAARPKYRVVAEFDDYRSLADPVNGLVIAGQPLVLFNFFEVQEGEGDEGWRLNAQLRPLGDVLGAGGLAGAFGLALPDEAPSVKLSVTLPGRVTSTNAPFFDGGTASWDIDQLTAPVDLRMQTVPEPFPTLVQAAFGAGALAIVLGLVLVVVGTSWTPKELRRSGTRRRRRRSRRRRKGDDGWSAAAAKDQNLVPAATVPLPWQTVKPSEQDARSARPPVGPDGSIVPAPPPTPPAPDQVAAPAAPTAAIAEPAPEPGWYADPEAPSQLRWWDGAAWTEDVRASGPATPG